LVFNQGIVSDENIELVDKKSLKYISALDKDQIPKIAGKELKAFSPLSLENIATEIEGLNISLNDWSDLLYSKDKITPKETFFLSGRVKEAIFFRKCLLTADFCRKLILLDF